MSLILVYNLTLYDLYALVSLLQHQFWYSQQTVKEIFNEQVK